MSDGSGKRVQNLQWGDHAAPWSNRMQSVDAAHCKIDCRDGIELTGSRWRGRDWDMPLRIGCGGDAYPPILIRD